MIISIDPGVRTAGFALWDGAYLHRAGLLRSDRITIEPPWVTLYEESFRLTQFSPFTEIVIERPQVYVRRGKGDPNDLIALALAAGLIVGTLLVEHPRAKVTEYLPATWKGQVPKKIMVERIKKGLTEGEHKRVNLPTAASLAHNVWDAVGIGLYHLRGARR